ncbi:MAG TPA: hypothetical protein VMN39_02355 [Longimicrobiaceae bacterium]|nr:hypothetical protein [Longimicrobiaceae bacterium]
MSTTLLTPPGASVPALSSETTRIPGHIPAVLFASLCVVVGVLWDISWHSSIGRDTLFSPPHLAIYLGGVVAGVACGWNVLHTTFAGLPEDRAASVTFWKYFRGPLGAWLCIWGAFAMITSAPFDDWWHNAYGLDVKILSPPHAVLAVGVLSIQLGALFMVIALQNRSAETAALAARRTSRAFEWMVSIAGGLVLLNCTILVTEYTHRVLQHGTLFYQIACGLLILPLAAVAVAGRLRWAATGAALTYTTVILALHFILPLFPAEPKLAPILFPLDRMLPPQFPLLLIVPAIGIDLVVRRFDGRIADWKLAATIAAVFLFTFLAVQWPFAEFLQSDLARNPIFKQDVRPYMVSDQSSAARGVFVNPATGADLVYGLAIALGLGVLSARLGLGSGRWMSRVRR